MSEHTGPAGRSFQLHRDERCIACGAPSPGEPIGVVRESEYDTTDLDFPVMRCPGCGLVYLYPRPAESELPILYPPGYYAYHVDRGTEPEASRPKGAVDRLVLGHLVRRTRARLAPVLAQAGVSAPTRVLDIGCGTGLSLDLVRAVYPGAETHGMDIDARAVAEARRRGHRAIHARFEEADLPADHFDLILSIHTLEHLARPDELLATAARLLTPKGVLLIETPNTDCLGFDAGKGGVWGGYHAPRHWYLFNMRAMRAMAARKSLRILAGGPEAIPYPGYGTFRSVLLRLLGKRAADALANPIARSLPILVAANAIDLLQLGATGRASGLWVALARPPA